MDVIAPPLLLIEHQLMPPIRIATRSSALARWQAGWVAARLTDAGFEVELVPMTTHGDTHRGNFGPLDAPGVFTKELQRALLAGEADVAVHSLKDLPTDEVPGLVLAAVPPRESVRDALCSRDGRPLERLSEGATVATGSLRRRTQLLHARADLRLADVRGNVDTRLKKLAAGEFDALVLAHAGLVRLGLESAICQLFEPEQFLPAVGQGALGIEACADDRATLSAVAALDDAATHRAIVAERALLAALRGGCSAPIGAWARTLAGGALRLDAVVLSADGRSRLVAARETTEADSALVGREVADQLLDQGAAVLIAESRAKR